MSGANIKISENKDSADSRRMTISGPPQAVRTAHQLIVARYGRYYIQHSRTSAWHNKPTSNLRYIHSLEFVFGPNRLWSIRLIVAAQRRTLTTGR